MLDTVDTTEALILASTFKSRADKMRTVLGKGSLKERDENSVRKEVELLDRASFLLKKATGDSK